MRGLVSGLLALAAVAGLLGLAVQLRWPAPPAAGEGAGAPAEPEPESGPAAGTRSWPERIRRALPGPAFGPKTAARLAPLAPEAPAGTAPWPALHPPRDFQAEPAPGGVRLRWSPHPKNPVEGLRYRLWRWIGDRPGELLLETEGLEFLDPVVCEEVPLHYRLRAVLVRPGTGGAPGDPEVRESAAAAARVVLPRESRFELRELRPGPRLVLVLQRPARPEQGPAEVGPGEEFARSGWILEEVSFRDAEVVEATRIPRFDALGRRAIIGGRPADRIREVAVTRTFARLRWTDPCGSPVEVELPVPSSPSGPPR